MIELLALGTVALLGLLLVEQLVRQSMLAVRLLLVLVVILVLLDGVLPPPSAGGFTVTYFDALFTAMAAAGVARLLRVRRLTWSQRGLVAICLLVLLSVMRGVGPNGVDAAVREARNFLYFFGGALYFSTVDPTEQLREAVGRWWTIAAMGLAAIVLVRWGALAAGLPPVGVLTRSVEAGGIRVIDNRNTLVIVEAMMMIIPLWLGGTAQRWERSLLIGFLPILILLQHRTIWIVTIVGIVLIVFRGRTVGNKALAAIVGAAVVIGIGVLATLPEPGAEDAGVVERSPSDSGTLEWRYQSWVNLVFSDWEAASLAAGRPFGGAYERQVNGYKVSTVPHNFYVETLLRIGVVGLVLMAALYAYALRRMHRGRHGNQQQLLSSETLFVILVLQLVYITFWTPDVEQGVLLGLALALANRPGPWTPPDQTSAVRYLPALQGRA
ncbi:MAG: O-antigen ligase family protein [Egibacteraceae bacterium]